MEQVQSEWSILNAECTGAGTSSLSASMWHLSKSEICKKKVAAARDGAHTNKANLFLLCKWSKTFFTILQLEIFKYFEQAVNTL